jgi:hypothetical protein
VIVQAPVGGALKVVVQYANTPVRYGIQDGESGELEQGESLTFESLAWFSVPPILPDGQAGYGSIHIITTPGTDSLEARLAALEALVQEQAGA